MKKIYIRPRDLDCKFVLSIMDTILEALSLFYVWKLKLILDKVENYCFVKQEDGSLVESEDCNGEYQEMVTRWWWTTAAASIFFSFFYSIALLKRLLKFLDYSDVTYYQDQEAFDKIDKNSQYLSFQITSFAAFGEQTQGRRLRGREVEQLIIHFGSRELERLVNQKK